MDIEACEDERGGEREQPASLASPLYYFLRKYIPCQSDVLYSATLPSCRIKEQLQADVLCN